MKQFTTLLEFFIKNREKAMLVIKQLGDLHEKFGELANNGLDILDEGLDGLDEFSRKLLANTTVEVIENQTISIESIKDYLLNIEREKANFKKVALLKLGYNNKSNKHEFVIQFLDDKNVSKKNTQLVLIQGKLVDDNLHKAFNDKELLILK